MKVGVIAFTVTRFEVPVIEALLASVAVSVYVPTVVSGTFTMPVPLLSPTVASTVDDPIMVILTLSLSFSTVLPSASFAVTITEDEPPADTGLVALTSNITGAPKRDTSTVLFAVALLTTPSLTLQSRVRAVVLMLVVEKVTLSSADW